MSDIVRMFMCPAQLTLGSVSSFLSFFFILFKKYTMHSSIHILFNLTANKFNKMVIVWVLRM